MPKIKSCDALSQNQDGTKVEVSQESRVFFLVLAGLAGIALVINYYASLSQIPNSETVTTAMMLMTSLCHCHRIGTRLFS